MNTFKHLSTQCLTITPFNKALTLVEVDRNATLRTRTSSLPSIISVIQMALLCSVFCLVSCSLNTPDSGALASDTSTQEHTISAASSDTSETNAPQPRLEKNLFDGQIAPRLSGMGEHGFYLSNGNERAQAFFNQAIALTYGFNHLEARRSFEQVALLAPQSALAYWGQALVLGPNINGPMESSAVQPAFKAISKAQALSQYASPKEVALIQALKMRYSQDESLSDRANLDAQYANAMRALVTQYPEDPNLRPLLAESLMVIHAWDYWNSDGRPKEWTHEILSVLEQGLQNTPSHAGLNHYYIHAVEASKQPERGLASAKVLEDAVPGAGHLVHMPSHIYIRTGRYQQGVISNENAILVDNNYIAQCRQQGVYPLAYVPHNRHFLWAMASMQGNSQKAINAAEHMAKHIDTNLMTEEGLGTLQHYWVTPWYAYVRFGKWDKIMSIPAPKAELLYPLAVWHYARGSALAANGSLAQAKIHLQQLQQLATNQKLADITVWQINDAYSVINIAALVLKGELAAKSKNDIDAIRALKKAVALEDELNYNEPSDWHAPVRQSLGAVLLASGDFAQAQQIYQQDLQVFPENGWSLYGLYQAHLAQGNSAQAARVKERFLNAWQYADITLKSSVVL
ncbi:tetratricopeptide repeat protein [Paraglaciecola chathamensis]|uniref:tetratricopeptide repeat protein n=1 Tax=Paraglaciecola chathamensis TaxID=368405 RepID=UPI002708CEA1|nr:tetratricopeptide repeat protein [Paraglaciecola chathamensis]MDO6838649.1 tetratricopeptide repeat protein [Paraglaciecola chathamensis]